MTEINEVNKRRGRKRKLTSRETQHPVYVDPDVWDAAGDLPISRPDIIRAALANAISFYKDDLPKLKFQLEEVRAQILALQSKEAVIVARIEQLEAKAVVDVSAHAKAEEFKEIAVKETLTMCKAFKRNMGYSQYTKLEELSGVDAAKIEAFVIDNRFRPTEEAVRSFYGGEVDAL